MIIVIGRGRSGLSAIIRTLVESGAYAGDEPPAGGLNEVATLFGEQVAQLGPYRWDFSRVRPPTTHARRLIHYLAIDALSHNGVAGWKVPEATLIFPWLVEMYPKARFIHCIRDPRDALRHSHTTDKLAHWHVPSMAKSSVDERIESWVYQREIVSATPRPRYMLDVSYEDFVSDQDANMKRLEAFLDIPLTRTEVDPSTVGYDDPFPVHPELLGRYGY